jgi:hypothetical protein
MVRADEVGALITGWIRDQVHRPARHCADPLFDQ